MRISPFAANRLLVVVAGILIVSGGTSAAWGGLLDSTPFALPHAVTGTGPLIGTHDPVLWKGSIHAAGSAPFGSNKIDADLEFAAFTSSGFSQFLTANALAHALPELTAALSNNEIIYAYQVVSVNDPTSPAATVVTVGLDSTDIPGNVSPPLWVSTGAGNEQDPYSGTVNPTSMKWNYTGPAESPSQNNLNIGEVSPIMIFSSRYLPEWDNVTISGGAAGHTPQPVPSIGDVEVPEPASILMAAFCLGVLLAFRRR